MPQNLIFCGIRVFINQFSILFMSSSNVCTILSAVCPSQRSVKAPFAILLYSECQGRLLRFRVFPTSRFVPIVTVSGCSAYVLNVMQGIPKKVASSATLPESVMRPWAWLTK